jgi:broad specificity phosphatase PhoE
MQTAQAIAANLNLQIIRMDGLIELNFGWLEGKQFKDFSSPDANPIARFLDNYHHNLIRIVSGESISHLRRRVLAAWQQIINENNSEISIVVGHSAVFNNILIHHFGKTYPKGAHYFSVRPCSISEIEINDASKARLVRLDDAAHLSEYK